MLKTLKLIGAVVFTLALMSCNQETPYSGNPVFKSPFTADPSALVHNDTLYIFTGSDEQAENVDGFLMSRWYVFSTTDMVNWTNHAPFFQ